MLENYDPASPIQLLNGIIITERSGLGKWGEQSKEGFDQFCSWLTKTMPINFQIAELGCYAGESTVKFASIAGKVYAIDPWENGYDNDDLASSIYPMTIVKASFEHRTKNFNNIVQKQMTGEMASAEFKNRSLDIVYIDAVHKLGSVRNDILRWLPKVGLGGYIAGHDFCGYWGEVVDAVLETIGLPDVRFKDGSWAKRIC